MCELLELLLNSRTLFSVLNYNFPLIPQIFTTGQSHTSLYLVGWRDLLLQRDNGQQTQEVRQHEDIKNGAWSRDLEQETNQTSHSDKFLAISTRLLNFTWHGFLILCYVIKVKNDSGRLENL